MDEYTRATRRVRGGPTKRWSMSSSMKLAMCWVCMKSVRRRACSSGPSHEKNQALEPDIRMRALPCAVPLRSRWARASDNTENFPAVLVICKNSIDKKTPNWTMFVDAYIPDERKLEMQRRFPKLPFQVRLTPNDKDGALGSGSRCVSY